MLFLSIVTTSLKSKICQDTAAPGVKVSDIIAINNLKHAWQFLFNTLEISLDYAYMCKLNQLVGGDNLIYGAGYIRTQPVTIGGTKWKPEMQIEDDIKAHLIGLQSITSPTEQAIAVMLSLARVVLPRW